MALIGLLVAVAALVDISVSGSRVHVRWRAEVTGAERAALERRYGLGSAEQLDATTWRYDVLDRSSENIRSLLDDPAVEDTAYIDRTSLRVPAREVHVSFERARFLVGPRPWQLLQPQSLVLFVSSAMLLWAASIADKRRRRALAFTVLVLVWVAAYVVPMQQVIRMGDSTTYISSRELFETYLGIHSIRYEAHLSYAILGRLYALYQSDADAPLRTLNAFAHGATAWFFICVIGIGFLEDWSPFIIRYLGLVLLLPSALLFFGYREVGQLCLNVAAFPLLAKGLADGSRRLEAGSALSGLGAALHGFGLLSLGGAVLAALGSRGRALDRVGRAVRILPWGGAAYVGWIAIYAIFLKLPIIPGHADDIPWRPWLADAVGGHDRVNVAILSARGARDLAFTAWVVGAPLLAVAVWMREYSHERRAVFLYAVPSVIFTILFWPIQGLAVEMDLVCAAFPAAYALMWLCAHDRRRTLIAAALLASAQLVFWRIVLDTAFINSRI